MTALTFGSLFSGVGGIDLGFERAGMVCKWQVEIDDYCNRVLARRWPNVRRYRDVREVGKHNLKTVSVIVGGFPCQPVSEAGKGEAQSDQRWLWGEFFRIVCEIRPRFIIVENVPGLLGRGMGIVLGDLASVGYDAEWQSIPAATFGAAHIRERVFIVDYPNSFGREHPQPILNQISDSTVSQSAQAWWTSDYRRGVSGRVFPFPDGEFYNMAHGLPDRVDGNRVMGNAVVPQVAEWLGARIVAAEAEGV